MRIAVTQRAALCEALRAAGPDAPTLCEGWSAHDLAAHVWLREHEPFSLAGSYIPALAGRTDARMAELKAGRPFDDLVDAIAAGPGRWSPYAIPAVDEATNGVEFFIHCEDVRRGGPDWQPRTLDAASSEWGWRQVGRLARFKLRRTPVPVVLENAATGEGIRQGSGDQVVTLAGEPGELLLWLFGRQPAARVTYYGSPVAVAQVAALDLRQ